MSTKTIIIYNPDDLNNYAERKGFVMILFWLVFLAIGLSYAFINNLLKGVFSVSVVLQLIGATAFLFGTIAFWKSQKTKLFTAFSDISLIFKVSAFKKEVKFSKSDLVSIENSVSSFKFKFKNNKVFMLSYGSFDFATVQELKVYFNKYCAEL